MTDTIRCPFCVLGEEFRPLQRTSQMIYVCAKCGHTNIPSDPYFECSCTKCLEMRRKEA